MIDVPGALQFNDVSRDVDIFVRHSKVLRTTVTPNQSGVPVAQSARRALQEAVAWTGKGLTKFGVVDDELHIGVVEQDVIELKL